MISEAALAAELANTARSHLSPPAFAELPPGVTHSRGKVREILAAAARLALVTTDRVSAFDRVLAAIPFKGEVLNRLTLHWFTQTADIVANHLIAELGPRSVLVHRCLPLPVEIVVRGYLTGSAWRDYQASGAVSGLVLPSGMRFNERFAEPIVTPSTKADSGEHDAPTSAEEVQRRGLVEPDLWHEVEQTGRALFRPGGRGGCRPGTDTSGHQVRDGRSRTAR